MINWKSLLAGAAVSLSLGLGAAHASTAITPANGWVQFGFGGVGSSFSDDFTFNGPVTLKVTDAFLSGDQFAVYDNGVLLGDTSTPTIGDDVGGNYDAAYADSNFSHGSWVLGAGAHDISGLVLQSPYGGGGAALQIAAGVPEAATWAMMLLGFGLGGAALRTRRRAVAAA